MAFNTLYSENFYLFTNSINNLSKKNILNFQNISLVYQDNQKKINHNFIKIKEFCNKNKIKLYILDNLKVAIQHHLNGIVLSGNKKINTLINKSFLKKNFKIIAKVHNQKEYMQNKLLGCSDFFLSPLFKNQKYSDNKFLGTNKFRLMSLQWTKNIYALGGINSSNLSKIKLLNCNGICFVNFINDPKIKKPTLFLRGRV
jgi:thiamine-phosphate pyrophosphorylase